MSTTDPTLDAGREWLLMGPEAAAEWRSFKAEEYPE